MSFIHFFVTLLVILVKDIGCSVLAAVFLSAIIKIEMIVEYLSTKDFQYNINYICMGLIRSSLFNDF